MQAVTCSLSEQISRLHPVTMQPAATTEEEAVLVGVEDPAWLFPGKTF
jgi:hypothetical protein